MFCEVPRKEERDDTYLLAIAIAFCSAVFRIHRYILNGSRFSVFACEGCSIIAMLLLGGQNPSTSCRFYFPMSGSQFEHIP